MMDRSSGMQQKMLCVTLESLMPEKHFLRDLDRLVDFNFIYDVVEHLYSHTGRRSVDPVIIVKMMLLGYLYGIDSERRIQQETQINIAYRWFLGIDLDEPVPDHSTISQLRRRKFNGTAVFEEIFTEIVRQCIAYGLIDGKLLLTDSTHVRANVRNDVIEKVIVEVEPSAYLQRLNEQAKLDGIYPDTRNNALDLGTKEINKSPADPDCGFMKRTGKPVGFYYLSHQTCDSLHGLITDVYVTPGNATDDSVHSARIQEQINKFGLSPEAVCADSGYDSSEIHADMLRMGIKTYIPRKKQIEARNGCFSANDFRYDITNDTYICPNEQRLRFTTYRPEKGAKIYRCKKSICAKCPLRVQCISGNAKARSIQRSSEKWMTDIQHKNNDNTPEYYAAMRLRKIWCEGNFAHQKANHNLTRVRKRGLGKASEHCLLSATALNLKRMVQLLTRRPEPMVITIIFPKIERILGGNPEYPLFIGCLSTAPKRDATTSRTNQYGAAFEKKERMTFITEGNVYRLITGSKLPAAERFEHWLFDEVLPCIRKYGAYITPSMRSKLSKNPSYIQELVDMLQREEELNANLMTQMTEERERLEHALAENKQLKEDNGELALICVDVMPKAAYYDAFIHPGDNTNLTITAKELGISPRKFIKLLEAANYLYRTSTGDLIPCQKWMDAGYFVVKDYFAHGHLGAYTLVTPIGKAHLHDLLDDLFQAGQE